jgi:hypothetical protein
MVSFEAGICLLLFSIWYFANYELRIINSISIMHAFGLKNKFFFENAKVNNYVQDCQVPHLTVSGGVDRICNFKRLLGTAR